MAAHETYKQALQTAAQNNGTDAFNAYQADQQFYSFLLTYLQAKGQADHHIFLLAFNFHKDYIAYQK